MTSSRSRARHGLACVALAAMVAACATPAATTGSGATGGAATQATSVTGPTTAASAPVAGNAVEACSLLSDADIKEITGFGVAKVIPNPADTIFPSACEWHVEGAAWQIVLGVSSPGGQATWNSLVPYAQGEAVTGIGDQAFVTDIAGDLMVRRGDTFFDIQYVAAGAGDAQDRLAKRVLQNLP